ncbi:MAG TPA: gluconate 2-dehydrogenase subunit 3 family protein [Galbitalea sp.]
MTGLPLDDAHGGDRFPGFDVLSQSRHWDAATREVVEARLHPDTSLRYFSATEASTAGALFDQLLDQPATGERVPVLELVDDRLARDETDGWRYETMPKDPDAWRRSLAALDADSVARCGDVFCAAGSAVQAALVQAVQDLGDGEWHAMKASQVWSLWTRYACTAFYSHPLAWQEMGFAGPAYPRGYKNLGVDRLEAFEVRDRHPSLDPARDGQ